MRAKNAWFTATITAIILSFVSSPIIACNGGTKHCQCSKSSKKCHCSAGKKCVCAKEAK